MMPEWVTDKAADSILTEMDEMQRLGKLSDEGLLMECLRSDAIGLHCRTGDIEQVEARLVTA